jgi:DNA-binding MarR family transcriptional regulator
VIELTAKGRAQVERIIPNAHKLERIAAVGVSAKDMAVVKRSLRRMYENMARQPR